jgi:hypothetical protein
MLSLQLDAQHPLWRLGFAVMLSLAVFAASARSRPIAIQPDTPAPGRMTVVTDRYTVVINAETPQMDSFAANGFQLVELPGLAATINTGAPWGPARATIEPAGPYVVYVKLDQMRWEPNLDGGIELHFYCYSDRVVARLDILPRSTPPSLALGWIGHAVQATPLPPPTGGVDWRETFGTDPLGPAAVLLPSLNKGVPGRRAAHVRIDRGGAVFSQYAFGSHEIGVRSLACSLHAATDEESLVAALERERAQRLAAFEVEGGRYGGYNAGTGLHDFIHEPHAGVMTITPTTGVRTEAFGAVRTEPYESVTVESGQVDIPVQMLNERAIFPIETGPEARAVGVTFSSLGE